jgi:hypothetical protein
MTASVKIAEAGSVVLDSVPSAVTNGTSAKSNFRSVFDQFHASRDSASNLDEARGASQQKSKEPDPATTLAVSPPVISLAEVPRSILPFSASIPLRQDTAAPSEEKPTQDAAASPDGTDAQDSAGAADRNALPAEISTTATTPTTLQGTLRLYSLPRVLETKTSSAANRPPSKTLAKSQPEPQDVVPSQTAATPADLAVAPSIPLEPAARAAQNLSTTGEASDTDSTSTLERTTAYQLQRSSSQPPTETAVNNRTHPAAPKVSDPSQAVTVPAPLTNPATNTAPPQVPIHSSTASDTPRPDRKTGSTLPQDSSATSGADAKTAAPPIMESSDNTAAAPNSGALAFAARLTPLAEVEPPTFAATGTAATLPGSQTAPQLAPSVAAKQIVTAAELPADARSGEGGGQSDKEKTNDLFAKPETLLPQMHASVAEPTTLPANNHTSANPPPAAARMDQVIDPPASSPNSNRDITVRIPDSTDQGTAVRFVERAGEIHVSVRTGDVELAQSLRGGLSDLTNRLENGGIRTEVWQPGPGAGTASSQSDSHQPFADPDGSNGRQHSSGSNSEQESKQPNKPRWVEELEGSIGNQNFKETQILWQA